MPAGGLESRFAKIVAARPRIILGSASSSRRKVMDDLASKYQFTYDVQVADIDERAIRRDTPQELVVALAHAKADAILTKMRAEEADCGASGYLITCDQVVVHEGCIREKPGSLDEARAFIAGYARSPARTVGGVVCTHLGSGRRCEVLETVTVCMAALPAAVVDALLAEGSVLGCAGGLMVEHPLVAPHVQGFEGGGQDSVMGLGAAAVMRVVAGTAEGR